jgi:hypothetical protein
MAVFAEIVAFRTQTNSRIKYGFRALFLSKKVLILKKVNRLNRKNPNADFYYIS